MRRRTLLALAAPLLLVSAVRADIADPNARYIMHTVRIEGTKEYAGKWRFFVVHRGFGRTSAEPLPSSGEIIANNGYWANALLLGAVAKGVKVPEDGAELFAKPNANVLVSGAIRKVRSVSKNSPHYALITRYKVVIKTPPPVKGKSEP